MALDVNFVAAKLLDSVRSSMHIYFLRAQLSLKFKFVHEINSFEHPFFEKITVFSLVNYFR